MYHKGQVALWQFLNLNLRSIWANNWYQNCRVLERPVSSHVYQQREPGVPPPLLEW